MSSSPHLARRAVQGTSAWSDRLLCGPSAVRPAACFSTSQHLRAGHARRKGSQDESKRPASQSQSQTSAQTRPYLKQPAQQQQPSPQKATQDGDTAHRFQYNYDPFTATPSEEHYTFPLVTASDLRSNKQRPRGVRMLARDFIDDSLYNPHYGYFSRQAVLLPDHDAGGKARGKSRDTTESQPALNSFGQGFDFSSMPNEAHFMRAVEERYEAFEATFDRTEPEPPKELPRGVRPSSAEGLEAAQVRGRLLAKQESESVLERDVQAMAARQVWHTPTELFKPHYARAIARYLVAEYKLHLYPYDDLVIYELGAGSGSLAQDVLRYIRDEEPEIYARTRYRIIEISARLATQQRARLAEHENVEIVNQSFLEWEDDVPEPCFVIALEVLDNFAHDVVRYSTATLQPYQALVSIDHTGDMHELWEPAKDPLISRYLSLRQAVRPSALPPSAPFYLRLFPSLLRSFLSEKMPLYPNLTPPHYVPTGALRFLDVLRRRFPLHRLVLSDFDALPDALEGVDAPVVQTRFKRTMIPVTNYRVLQGFFDIFFPTNFELLRDVYGAVMASSPSPKSGSEVPVPPSRTSRNVAGAGAAPPKGPASPRPSPLATSSSLRPDYFSASAPLRAASASAFAHESSGAALARRNTVKIYSHADFLSRFAEVERTRTRDGANPMVGWYANAKFFCS